MLSTSFLTKSKYTNGSTGQWGLPWEPNLPFPGTYFIWC